MKKRLFRLFFLTGTLLTLLTACEYDYVVPVPSPPPPPAGDTISFSQDIQPIFTAKCSNCHPNVYKPNLSSGSAYSSLSTGGYIGSTPETSLLYQKISSGGSMSSYITSGEVNLIYRWIYAGAKND